MKFELDNSFDDNLALFKAEAEKIDPECAKILFDNLHRLDAAGDAGRSAISDFHSGVASALDALQTEAADGDS
jgi:hypothetical protein